MFDSSLPIGERVAVLEEHARQEVRWRGGTDRWRETISREVAIINVKIALFSALGGAVGSAVVGAVLYLTLGHGAGNHS